MIDKKTNWVFMVVDENTKSLAVRGFMRDFNHKEYLEGVNDIIASFDEKMLAKGVAAYDDPNKIHDAFNLALKEGFNVNLSEYKMIMIYGPTDSPKLYGIKL